MCCAWRAFVDNDRSLLILDGAHMFVKLLNIIREQPFGSLREVEVAS